MLDGDRTAGRASDQMALSSVSPVRTRTAWSMGETKILPWPISGFGGTDDGLHGLVVCRGRHHLDLDLGQEITVYSLPR